MAQPQAQTDPWVEAAKNFKADPQSVSAPASSGNDDWKIWQQDDSQPGMSKPPATDWLSKTIGQKEQPAIESALQPTMHDASQGVMSNIMTGVGNMAKGAGHFLTHPEEMVTGAVMSSPPVQAFTDLRDAYKHMEGEPNAGDQMREHPAENLEYAAGEALPMMAAGGAEALPSKARAIGTLDAVANAAKDVPVKMAATEPAVQGYRDFVGTGGRNARVMTKLGNRLDTGEPMNFPEARKFYSNVSEASARPGFLRRAIESPSAPKMRYQMGGVREAMNDDLTNALEPTGMSDKYTQGLREYANAAKMSKAAKIGGAVATEEALRRSGILGKLVAPMIGQ